MTFSLDRDEPPGQWAGVQPKFERLEYERPGRFFLVGKLVSGETVRVRLSAVRYEQRPGR